MELRKIAETDATLTLEWTPPADVGGYVLYAAGQVVSVATRNVKGGSARTSAKFSKTTPGPPFEIVAVRRSAAGAVGVDAGIYPAPEPPAVEGSILYRQDWEHPNSLGIDEQQWGRQCDNIQGEPVATRGTVTKVSSPRRQGGFAGKFSLPRPFEGADRSACELLHGRHSDQHGVEDWYAISVWFPADWREPSPAHWGMSFLQANYTAVKGGPVCLFAHADFVNLVFETGAIGTAGAQFTSGNGVADGNMGTFYAIPRERFAKEVWHDLLVRVRWTPDPGLGLVEVFHRRVGETAWALTARVTGYPTWQWREGADPNAVKQTTDKIGANRAGGDPISYVLDNFCRATSRAAAESIFG